MFSDGRPLRLTSWPEEILLVPALEASRLEREEGAAAVSSFHAEGLLAQLAGPWGADVVPLREFAGQVGLLDPLGLARTPTATVVAGLVSWVRCGRLVAIRRGQGAQRPSGATEDEALALVAELRRETKGGVWAFEGARYELVPGWQVAAQIEKTYAQVVPFDQAGPLLERAARAPALGAPVCAKLTEAVGRLARPWLTFETPDGLVLLRHEVVRADMSKPDLPLVTPSALRASEARDWFELEVKHHTGGPYDGPVDLAFTDKRKETVSVAKTGRLHLDNVMRGHVAVTLPDLDEQAWG
jgi:hypothetical protein